MEDYKIDFLKYLLVKGALRFGNVKLKSKRESPYFFNLGQLSDGVGMSRVGDAYAMALIKSQQEFDHLYGIPEKGVALAVATSMGLARLGKNVDWFFTRKYQKTHGEVSGSWDDVKKIVGALPNSNDKVVLLDDVLTTGGTKYSTLEELEFLFGKFDYSSLMIALDRQEVGIDGKNAVEEFTSQTGIPVNSIISALDVYHFIKGNENFAKGWENSLENYLRVYGTEEARSEFLSLEQKLSKKDKGMVVACDVDSLEKLSEIVHETWDLELITGYKVGFELALTYGLEKVVATVKNIIDKPVIYDHQKAGTDIPDTGKKFMKVCKNAGVDAVILFPQAGPETERAWIYQGLEHELNLIVGGFMTHPAYLESEGGFISEKSGLEIYKIAARAGVNNFVVPGTKPQLINNIRAIIEAEGIDPIFYSPGFVAQGADIAEADKVMGDKWHAIVGRGIYAANNIRQATLELIRKF